MTAGEWWLSLETYAEERDSWSPSYRARVDSKLRVPDGAEQRVRLADGSELVATWSENPSGSGGCWLDELGEQVFDVAHVYLGKRVGGESGSSGPSGPTLTDAQRAERGYARPTIRFPVQVLEHLDELAEAAGVSRTERLLEIIEDAWRKRAR